MRKSGMFTVFMVVFIGLTGFSFLIPLLPFLALQYGANEFVLGLLLASYALFQLIGAPILGRLSDRYGRRPVLLVSTLGTFVSLLLVAFAQNLVLLFASRILDGLTGGNIAVAQAYVTDVTDEHNRSRGLGMLGAAFGLGFIFGPALSGVLSAVGRDVVNPAAMEGTSTFLQSFNWEYALPAFVASAIGLVNVLQVIFTLPESLTEERRAELKASAASDQRGFSLGALQRTLERPRIGPLLVIRFLFSVAFSMFQAAFSLWGAVKLGMDATGVAGVLTYVGFIQVFVQGFAVGKLTDRFSDAWLLFWAAIGMTVGLAGWAISPSVPALLLAMLPISFSGGVFNTVINSALTKTASRSEAGGILGISASLESFTRVIGPVVGNSLIGLGTWLPGIFGAGVTAATALFAWNRVIKVEAHEKEKVGHAD
ncbi:MFS transporter [Phototrophicus methaneseepsis]|uniref:MFS transporter n=1 Tax=Phototrophicus methaneseepsis TaxID=2710758 RepID=A0A7S8ED83_9CHLR|nr:MFS transporter [Phototrophicus methaneseepsis]QPC84791.1 MFS transporter [Phototrophicus methaneseepsis]